jgi:hypothetical protein
MVLPPVALTVSDTEVVRVRPPPVPVTVMEEVPVGVEALVEIVRVEVPEPGAAMLDGLKEAVAPEGRPEAESATAELKPPETELVIVLVAEAPWLADTLDGEAESAKSGVPPPPDVIVKFTSETSK